MIYVRRNANLIPAKVLDAAREAQEALEALPADERPQFIRDKAGVWRAFSRYLRRMSYRKCWYSESPDPQSFFDVDHFRPKLRARRSSLLTDYGYQWLAFSWDNFRYSAQKSNRLSINDDSEETDGKGDWFELLPGSPVASWEDRCENSERPVLLDPVNEADVKLIDVLDDGRMGPSRYCIGSGTERVKRSIQLYGLNLPGIARARRQLIRDIRELHDVLQRSLAVGAAADPSLADALPVIEQIEILRAKTHPRSPYSRAARAELIRLGAGDLCMSPEEVGLDDEDEE